MANLSTRPSITHIIFDMDGLLIDTENFYTQVQQVILARFGKTFDWSLKAKMMGAKAIESAKMFVEETGISDSLTPEQFLVEREDMLQTLFPTCNLMPGVSRLINHLKAYGLPMAVATGSHKRHFDLKTQNHGDIFLMMHHIVLGDDPDVKKGKPSPDIFLAAARRFEGVPADPSKILVFEDAPSGVAAAKSAGMDANRAADYLVSLGGPQGCNYFINPMDAELDKMTWEDEMCNLCEKRSVVMVPDPRLDSSYHSAADQVLSSLLDFNPVEWGLPPFKDVAN
ncbi:hypothetical protein IFM89_012450 [Coptis chinensis]|uniref:glycerol-1-phosphatase n=1 Tax=Coptis chinensis TaxID=261450 RepID=A0A835ICL8_9MAGN|nr:hypothetical protein IFM89_012450 [Coptis chinensis]